MNAAVEQRGRRAVDLAVQRDGFVEQNSAQRRARDLFGPRRHIPLVVDEGFGQIGAGNG